MPQTALAARCSSLVISRRHFLFGLLCLAWILPGLLAHDPWKPDEAYTFGVVYEMLQGGSWIAPTLAGEPFLREPPLFYLSAALERARVLSAAAAARRGAACHRFLCRARAPLLRARRARVERPRLRRARRGAPDRLLRSRRAQPPARPAGRGARRLRDGVLRLRACACEARSAACWLGTGLGIVFLSQGIPEMLIVLLIARLAAAGEQRMAHARLRAARFGLAVARRAAVARRLAAAAAYPLAGALSCVGRGRDA